MSAKYTFLAWDTPIENAPLKLALLQLANNADDDGFSYYSISKMATSCGMSEKTFQRKIAEMEKMGILTVNRRANRTSLYSLVGDEMGVTLCRLQDSEATESLQGGTESRLVSDRESHDLNSTPNTTPDNKHLSVITDGFDHWWNLYPVSRRKNKSGCFNKFKVKCKNLDGDQVEDLVNNISADIEKRILEVEKSAEIKRTSVDDEIKYMPTTEPYINQERWMDGE